MVRYRGGYTWGEGFGEADEAGVIVDAGVGRRPSCSGRPWICSHATMSSDFTLRRVAQVTTTSAEGFR